jgi:hypothetical protein
MIKCEKVFPILSVICFIVGCQQENVSYSYLLQHPKVLQVEYDRCLSQSTKTFEQQEQCKVVNNAAKTITDMLAKQRAEPEKFGFQVLEAESSVQNWHDKILSLSDELAKLKATAASNDQISKVQSKLTEANNAYQAKQQEVATLLAVIGLSSPE